MERLRLKGFVTVKLYRGKRLLRTISGPNLITTVGKNSFAQRIAGDGGPPAGPSYVAFGLTGSPASLGQTALVLESVVIPRAALTPTRTNNVITYAGTGTNAGITQTILEMGIFNLNAAGVMFSRFLPQTFQFEAGLTCSVNWAITVG